MEWRTAGRAQSEEEEEEWGEEWISISSSKSVRRFSESRFLGEFFDIKCVLAGVMDRERFIWAFFGPKT